MSENLENILLEKLRPLIKQIFKEELEALKTEKPSSPLLSVSQPESTKLSESLEDKINKVADFIIQHKRELGF